ncbi:hypothetical protein AGLY_017494 [Aphis glycines]|uniref:Uncharacterized protein n=1 Tax=Aphis glycines TaxID=307491 RepID=A0A6G0SUP8_APHGL|nr:hypothetical protein AGLY_017494 [Aphis glycines]
MDKNLLENLITSKKNIKRKIMEMKPGVIDSDNYFHETFRPILEPLNILSKKNKSHISHNYPVDQKNIEVQYASDEDDDNLNSSYNNFFNTRPQLRGYDRSYGMYYDKATDKLKIADFPMENLRHKDTLNGSNAKQKKIHNNSTIRNESFEFSPEPVVPTFKEPPTDELFKFSLSPQIKKGSGLYKDVVPQTQLVYYDDPNELVARLNLLTSAQSAGLPVRIA